MRACLKCGDGIPKFIVVEGRRRNLQNRKFCFSCSPFGEHNTRNLLGIKDNHSCVFERVCATCNRPFNSQRHKGTQCYACFFKKKEKTRSDKVHALVGESCWVCGYNKGVPGRRVLSFHHMNPAIKEFGLSSRECTSLRWSRVEAEIKKCALLCCRCHTEFHAGLLSLEIVQEAYEREWQLRGL